MRGSALQRLHRAHAHKLLNRFLHLGKREAAGKRSRQVDGLDLAVADRFEHRRACRVQAIDGRRRDEVEILLSVATEGVELALPEHCHGDVIPPEGHIA